MKTKDNMFQLPEIFQKSQRLATIIKDSDDAITLQGLDGTIMAWNKGAEKLYVWTDTEVIGRNIERIIPPHKLREEKEMIEKIISGEIVPSFETQRVNKHGNIIDVWLTATLLYDEDGRPESIATTERDITKIKRNIKGLKIATDKLSQQNKELNVQKNKILGIVAHYLRSPIVVIKQAVGLIGKQSDSIKSEHNAKLLGIIERANASLNNLVNDLLNISKIETGKIVIKKTECDYEMFLRENIDLMQIIATEHDIDIKIKYLADKKVISFDKERMRQVINNLLDNAIKYSQDGTTINVVVDQAEDDIIISVVDRGEGIPEEYIPNIFDEFYKIDRKLKTKVKSTGLGLAIVKKNVELHGGKVWVESDVGEGSSFHFTLPINNIEEVS